MSHNGLGFWGFPGFSAQHGEGLAARGAKCVAAKKQHRMMERERWRPEGPPAWSARADQPDGRACSLMTLRFCSSREAKRSFLPLAFDLLFTYTGRRMTMCLAGSSTVSLEAQRRRICDAFRLRRSGGERRPRCEAARADAAAADAVTATNDGFR